MKFRKKPVVVEATQWFKNGDHPDDACRMVQADTRCKHCDTIMHVHGWIDTKEGGHIVCPGDWIITGVAGEMYPCKRAIFDATYDRVAE